MSEEMMRLAIAEDMRNLADLMDRFKVDGFSVIALGDFKTYSKIGISIDEPSSVYDSLLEGLSRAQDAVKAIRTKRGK